MKSLIQKHSRIIFGLTSILIFAVSCSSNEHADETKPVFAIPIGEWKSDRMYSTNIQTGEMDEANFSWDYLITEDSIAMLTYPNFFYFQTVLDKSSDSLSYNWIIDQNFAVYQTDSTLALVCIRSYNNSEYRDSTTFTRETFDLAIIDSLKKHGFNKGWIEKHDWGFQEESTKNYFWPEYDTLVYSPHAIMSFIPDSNYFVGYNKIRFQQDTFTVSGMNDSELRVYHIINEDTVQLVYKWIP